MMSTNNILSPANGDPIIVPSQDIVLGIYYLTRERPLSKGEGKVFSSPEEVIVAHDAGELDLHASIKVRIDGKIEETTTGRVLLYEVLPEKLPFSLLNRVMNKKELRILINESYRRLGIKATVILSDRLKDIGYRYATLSGISISMKDMTIPSRKAEIIEKAEKEVKRIDDQYKTGLITDGEKYNKVVDIWAQATEMIASEMMSEMAVEAIKGKSGEAVKTTSFNPIFMMSDSGARGSKDQMRQLAGMRGLMAKPSGEIIETPITSNFREGLTVLQYFISTHGARKGLADTALKTANSGYLTRRLVDVAQDTVITEEDCGTLDGISVSALIEGGEIIQRVGDRVLGRTALEDIYDPVTGDLLVPMNEEINEEKVAKMQSAGLERARIRSVLTCQAKRGVCKKCYGRDLAHGHEVNIGEAIGIIAAQSIGEPGTQLTMRTFHIGGTASKRVEQTTVEARNGGTVSFQNLKTVQNVEGHLVVMNRNGEIAILGKGGREVERYPIIYGAVLKVRDGETIQPNQTLAEWDPFNIPILTEVSGVVKYGDILDGVTMQERRDKVTGKISRVIVESREIDARPRVSIKDSEGGTAVVPGTSKGLARYHLPIGAIIMVNEGDTVSPGTVLAKIPRETTKTKDITGGLPRVAELFEVRKPKENAILSEIDGTVSFGQYTKGRRRVTITPEIGEPMEYLIPKGKHVSVLEGDYVRAGEPLMDGSANPHDILRIQGIKALAKYLGDEVQEVYRLQGVSINDKHIEVIVRQMLRQVSVTAVGDSNFLLGEHVERWRFEEENQKIIESGGKPATAEPLLLGITKASLSTESFISAASFQETTKVLSDAAVAGKVDYLKGLKENVIMGRLIPAGTGLPSYRNLDIALGDENV
jgi:DNA-directed RNA polymerase subunit beta'